MPNLTPRRPLRIVMPSIVDPRSHRGGAGTLTRTLVTMLSRDPMFAAVTVVAPAERPRWRHRARQAASLASTLVSATPAKIRFLQSRTLSRALAAAIDAERPDLVLLNGTDLVGLLPALPHGIPRVVVAHNVEHEVYQAQIDSLAGAARVAAPWLVRDCRRLRHVELDALRRIGRAIVLSERDRRRFDIDAAGVRAFVLPPCFEGDVHDVQRPLDAGHLSIGLLANFDWWPNGHGRQWFVRHVLDHIDPRIHLHVYGQGSDRLAPHARVTPHGFAADLRTIWRGADVMICPVRVGGGASVKLAEILYHRRPVVASPFAADGLPTVRDAALVIRDTPSDWISFLNSPAVWALRMQRASEATSALFASASHQHGLASFLDETLRTSG
jgi:hypothetical protein